MPKGTQTLSTVEMRALILEALAIEDTTQAPRNGTFKRYGYRGTLDDLRAIVEHLAISRGMIDKVVEIPNQAWGAPGEVPWYKSNTNFCDEELDTFYEQSHFLIFQNVISPGARGNMGHDLPYFHITKYGLNCISKREILPYDPDGYLTQLKSSVSVDDWEVFYVSQSLLCYNSGAMEASIIMLGLAGEYLAERLVEKMGTFLAKSEPALQTTYAAAIQRLSKISQKYTEYEKILTSVAGHKDVAGQFKYPILQNLKPTIDAAAKTIYATYLRLNRNELAHPNAVRMEKIECLTMLVSFLKYSETQHKYLDFYIANS